MMVVILSFVLIILSLDPIGRIANMKLPPIFIARKLNIPIADAKIIQQFARIQKKSNHAEQALKDASRLLEKTQQAIDNVLANHEQIMTEMLEEMNGICDYIDQHPEFPEDARIFANNMRQGIIKNLHDAHIPPP